MSDLGSGSLVDCGDAPPSTSPRSLPAISARPWLICTSRAWFGLERGRGQCPVDRGLTDIVFTLRARPWSRPQRNAQRSFPLLACIEGRGAAELFAVLPCFGDTSLATGLN